MENSTKLSKFSPAAPSDRDLRFLRMLKNKGGFFIRGEFFKEIALIVPVLCLRKVAKWIWRVCVILVVYYTDATPVQFWLSLHRYWTDFNNVWCFVKLRPSSRRYADLEGILVHFDPPARTISIIANPKIHFHDLHYEVDIYEFYQCYDRYGIGKYIEIYQNIL